MSSRRDHHVAARTVSGKAGQVPLTLRLEASFRPLDPRAVYSGRPAADKHEARALSSIRQTPIIPLAAWASSRATLASGTIRIQAGQTYEQAVIWERLRVRSDPSKEWSRWRALLAQMVVSRSGIRRVRRGSRIASKM